MSKIKAKNTLYNDPRYDVVVDSRMLEQHLKEKDQQIAELQKQLEEKEKKIRQLDNEKGMLINSSMRLLKEKEKDNQFLKNMYLSEKQKNDNYHSEKYGLDKPAEELRKIKLNPKEKEIYYKGFDNCERQFATHIAELQQQLQSQPAEIVEKIRDLAGNYFYENSEEDLLLTGGDFTEILDTVLKCYEEK